MIDVLFCEEKSNYNLFDDVRTWTKKDNAINYKGQAAIICHPPCPQWSQLRHFSKKIFCQWYCAIFAINTVRKNGGIVEHPDGSNLFNYMGCGKPGLIDKWGGYCVRIDQNWFGHKARKSTILYVVGIPYSELPAFELSFNRIDYVVCSVKKNTGKKELSKKNRNETPVNLCKYLINLANEINKLKLIK